ncbi:MAG: hypothetical protein V7749_00300 [Cocleimonas sp.]
MTAISEPDQLVQISLVSELIAEQCWKPFTTTVSTIMEAHKSAIRALIEHSLKHVPEAKKNLLERYDSILANREMMANLSMSLPKKDDEFGDEYENTFASRITFSDAFLTEFDMNKFSFDKRIQNMLYQLIQKVMPYQFECSTLDLNSNYNGWITEELFSEDDIEMIGQYISMKQGGYEIEQLCTDLKLNDEMISTIEDYGIEGAYDYWCMCQLEKHVTELSKNPKKDIQKSLTAASNKHPELLPIQALYAYFEHNIKPFVFPFDMGSDVDVSEQLIYSFGNTSEEICIQEASERFYNGNEVAALNIRFSDDKIIDFFENYSISNCMVSLLTAVIELRD